MSLGSLNIKKLPLADMNPAPYNPRVIDAKARKGLSNSIDEFGLVEPIIYNSQTGNIVGGHQRYSLLKEKNVAETDVVIVDLPLDKEKALNIALNHHGITGKFDENSLQALLANIDTDLLGDLNLNQLIEETADNDILKEFDLDDDINAMAKDVKTSLVFNFTSDQIDEARSLVKTLEDRKSHIGTIILKSLREYVIQ